MTARTLLLSCVAAVAVLFTAGPAAAEKPNRAFAGKIIMANKRLPMQAKSLAAYNAKVRAISKTNFLEDKEKQQWKIYFGGFLRAPLNDLEYLLKVYDISTGRQQLLLTAEQFTHERGLAALIGDITLKRKDVGVNKHLLITMENKGKVLCSGRFKIIGEGERYTGKVDFSEEEAK